MPVDPSHNPHTRRTAKRTGLDEELDTRRARGEISCAECRRLKLKCDKKLPCSSCVRRGCPSICPNGSLSTGQGTRFVLADTTQLHTKIAEMGQRIRQLEDALAIFQSGVSSEPHPLLVEPLLSIKFGPEKNYVTQKENTLRKEGPSSDKLVNAFGTMTISDGGDGAKYFGPSAGSETLFLAGAEFDQSLEDDVTPAIQKELETLSASFPMGTESKVEESMEMLVDHLPPEPRAWSLCETYMEQAAWAFRPVARDELIQDILSPIYKCVKGKGTPSAVPAIDITSPHKLGVLYLVFALGSLVDLTLEAYSQEAEFYFRLGKASFALRSVFDSPEVATVQGVSLMAVYHGMAGKRYTVDSAWSLTSLAAKLAQSLGMHRDPARWHMDPKTVQRRRALFWELFSCEQFYSLAVGRPPAIRLSYIDTEFPEDDEATVDEHGNILVGYYQWKYEFTRDIFASVIEQSLTAQAPQYSTILELDQRVREKVLPPHLNVFLNADDKDCTPSGYMKKCLLGQYRAITLLYLHRSFFVQAMLDHPKNPLQSPFAPSFLAAYRCASGVIKSSLNHYDRFPQLCPRIWGIWTHLFSAAVIVGAIVTRSPQSSMASSAFIELGLACVTFEKGALQSRRARSGLAILYKIREKAFQIYSHYRTGKDLPQAPLLGGTGDEGADALALFGGQTRVLVSKLFTASRKRKNAAAVSSAPSPVTSASSPASDTTSTSGGTSTDPGAEVHPALMDYLSKFPSPELQNADVKPGDNAALANMGPYPPSLDMDDIPMVPEPEVLRYQHEAWSALQSGTFQPQPTEAPAADGGLYTFPTTLTDPSNVPQSFVDPEGNMANLQFTDFNMMMTGDPGMDEQWMALMRDSIGLLDPSMSGTPYSAPPPTQPQFQVNSGAHLNPSPSY